MILIALPLVLGLIYWFGQTKKVTPLTPDTVKVRFAQDYPGLPVNDVQISDDGYSALILELGEGQVGLVHAIGQHQLTRLLDREVLRDVKEHDQGIDLYVNDFTLRLVTFPVADVRRRENLLNKLAFK